MSTTRSRTANSQSAVSQQSASSRQSAGSQQSAGIFGIDPGSFQQNVDRADRVDPRLHNIPPCSIDGGISSGTLEFDPRVFDEDVERAKLETIAREAEDAMESSDWARIAAGDA